MSATVIVSHSNPKWVKGVSEEKEKRARRAVNRGIIAMHGAVLISMEQTAKAPPPKGARKTRHRPSLPGHPPAIDTGNLRSHTTFRRAAPPDYTAVLIVRAEYAGMLEFGTALMKARPFLRPVYDRLIPGIQEDIAKALGGKD